MSKASEKAKEYIKGISSEYKEDAAIDYIAGYAQAVTDLSTENDQLKEALREMLDALVIVMDCEEPDESARIGYESISKAKQLLNKK